MPRNMDFAMDQPARERIDAVFAAFDRDDAPGGAVAVASNGQTIYRKGFGLADLARRVRNTPVTTLPIASITKHMTCAALLQLQHDGALSIDDRVGDWLPDLPPAQRRPTLRQLMTHTGGIRCYLDQALYNGYATMPGGMPLVIQSRQTDINFEPGDGSSYCNGGYLLLSLVVERASRMPLGDYLQGKFFSPLGMASTRLPRFARNMRPGAARTYLRSPPGGWRPGLQLTEEQFGDGGAWSSIDDMSRWMAFLRRGGPVSLASLAQRAQLANGWTSDYGFGLISERWRGMTIVNHAGGLPGASSLMLMLPEAGVDVILLFNRNAPLRDLALAVLRVLLGDRLEAEAPAPRFADHAGLAGHYFQPETGFMLGFDDVDGALGLSLFGGPAFPLDGRIDVRDALPFGADVGTGEMRFRRAEQAGAILFSDAGRWREAVRIDAQAPSSFEALLRDGAGTFLNTQVAATLELVESGGAPAVRFQGEYGGATYGAELVAPDMLRFRPNEFPGGMIARLVRRDGEVEAIVVSTGRSRATRFDRAACGVLDMPAARRSV